jgi:hypothetical protein
MRRAVDLLARLERHALDEQRLALTGILRDLERQRAAKLDLSRRLAFEHATAFELPGGPRQSAAYLEVAQARGRALRAAETRLKQEAAAAEARLGERVRSWKGLDLVASELRRSEANLARRLAAAQVEEAAALRVAAQNSGASVTSSPSSAGPNLIWQDRRELSRTSNASSSIML